MNKNINCPGCGKEISGSDNFCRFCGYKLKNQTKAENAPAQNFLSNKIILIFTGIIVIVVVLVFILNKTPQTKPEINEPKDMSQTTMGNVPAIDHQRIAELKSIAERDAGNTGNLIALANLLHDSNLPDEAILYYKKYLTLKPTDPDAMVDLGICYYELGDNKTAIMEMEKAIKLDPKHQKAFFNIGIINLKDGNLQKANEYFKKCYELDTATPTGMQAKEIMDQHQNLKSKNK